jgi:hypothetical protein
MLEPLEDYVKRQKRRFGEKWKRGRQLRRPYFFLGNTFQCSVKIAMSAAGEASRQRTNIISIEYLRVRLARPVYKHTTSRCCRGRLHAPVN